MVKYFLRSNVYFLAGWFIFVVLSLWFISSSSKGDEILLSQTYHQPILDIFFYGLTLIFESPYLWLVFLFIIFWSWRKFILLLLSYALASSITQILKRIFAHVRPAEYFLKEKQFTLYSYLETRGEELPHFLSFPSGHATVAFAIMSTLTFLLPKPFQLPAVLLAIMIGLSRVYLSCHFLEDVVAGSLVGVFSSALIVLTLKDRVLHFMKK